VQVIASALSQLTRARASGAHYSAAGSFPLVPGVDGTGLLDGRPVYFLLPRAPFGAMADYAVVPESHCIPLPAGLDAVTAAVIANPGMSSWAALTERARFAAGESVLINGATGASGQLAIRIARHMGASRIVATGRNQALLATLGADAIIPLGNDDDALEAAFRHEFAQGIDVVLDYLWGPSAERLLVAAAKAGPAGRAIRVVQIGTASGADIHLPGAALRSSGLELMGSGIGSVPLPRLLAAIDGVFHAAGPAGLTLPTRRVPIADVQAAWALADGERTVFTMA